MKSVTSQYLEYKKEFIKSPLNTTFSLSLRLRQELLQSINEIKDAITEISKSALDEEAVKRIIETIIVPIKEKLGETPTDERLNELIQPLIPKIESGYVPIKGKDYFTKSELDSFAKLIQSRVIIPRPIPGVPGVSPKLPDIKKMIAKEMSSYMQVGPRKEANKEDILKIAQSIKQTFDAKQWADAIARAIEDLPLRKKLDYDTGLKNKPVLQAPTSKGGSRMGRGTAATVYSETPSGLINGSNKIYTTTQKISTILSFAINGQVIHPPEYTAVNSTITFVTALDASLTGLSFTIVYI